MSTVVNPTQIWNSSFNTQSLRIVALGDSLVYGYGDLVGGGWVERLRRQWMGQENGHVLYNLGVRGDRTHQVAQRLEGEYRYRGELRNRVPDLIMLSVGVNDSARLRRANGRLFTDFETYQQEIENLLDEAQQLCPVYFVGMVPVDEAKMPFIDCFYFNHFDQYRYKEVTKKACHSRNIPYLDIFDLWLGRGENYVKSRLINDGLHPNVKGYESLYEDIINWQALQQLNMSNVSAIV
ncbi:GDSL-type esterase/lipase family protein [Crocosphaera watsonii]|uniref:Lipolytic enzyme, G-D-S-L n=2 Tax=Crocosphaera watsonii TaxID=263511 RepID=G5J734_CROWT|nr:GDSL-type esterase/lipase family protein [Crocosphaera watsonii]EHJ11996.1 Lipolytic enzyme, G-D-S-L [Crocosphaera watsonii WH 0003]CCQ57206.1 Lipolytic enzyme, G-D-S-L [Crocosphaera watsonii WH 0005]